MMLASESGCYNGYIENGFVETSSCQAYSWNSPVYCPYYCNVGYKKTASIVYCAGNDKWLPAANLPTDDICVKDGDSISGCHNSIYLDNGYVLTSSCQVYNSSSKADCQYSCYNGHTNTSQTVYCAGNERWLPTGYPFENVLPCITNGINPTAATTTTTTTTERTIYTTARPPRSTVPGYYDDPSLRMNVSPVFFVGVVVGGMAILVLLLFALFLRAHRKSSRESRARSICIISGDHSHTQYQNDRNAFTNHNSDQHDDSDFRNIARRILARATNDSSTDTPKQNGPEPPPYEASSSTNTGISPERSVNLNEESLGHNTPSPPYTAVNIRSDESQQSSQYDQREFAFNSNANPEVGGIDKPPPYEASNNREANETLLCVQDNNLPVGSSSTDPLPPYIAYKGND